MAMGDWTRRDFFRRAAAAGAVTIGGPMLLSACASSDDTTTFEGAKESGKIKVGFGNEAPYGFTGPDGQLTGAEPEIARVVLRNMGIGEIEAVPSDFGQLIPGLQAKKFAIVAAGMSIRPDRCENASFSAPEFKVASSFLVPKGNPMGITRFEDITGKDVKIAVMSGAVEKDYAKEAGVPDDKIITIDTQDNVFRQVQDGRVYGAALLDITSRWLLKQNEGAPFETTESFQGSKSAPDVGAFTFRKEDTEFVNAFNTELQKVKDSGQWLEIVTPFGFSEANAPGPELKTEELCKA
ncbi:ectoine/hydroxyectoine ABC transporter substrate-binding protein EhuB [Amycolatopsis antarctica]|uniref:Ectoine/hydroxyectoine ABC transporter substrate-binding protein EhuB n=1 Tax=Amycolatopsis antarctica TaxID=1854586 RepID=A0A263D5R4_9PSEU|nr:ectoine/hydroxyectoine ABC transporter substrate-binding protein EhuB [Amycolatopsis antarctica]OZM73844.1 ectoine/hydroxyectoine ABC transporter substrate-binding protein EhuB [Amycolatopsis antarctica]